MSVGSIVQGITNNISKDVKGVETGFSKILPYALLGLVLFAVASKK